MYCHLEYLSLYRINAVINVNTIPPADTEGYSTMPGSIVAKRSIITLQIAFAIPAGGEYANALLKTVFVSFERFMRRMMPKTVVTASMAKN